MTEHVAHPSSQLHPFSHLVLGSGGMSGMSYLGILRYMQEHNMIRALKHVFGVSIGAFFGYLFALDMNAGDVETEIKSFFEDDSQTFTAFKKIGQVQLTFGMDDGDRLICCLENLACAHVAKDAHKWSFLDFVKHTGRTLTVVATDVFDKKPVFFSVDTTPDVNVLMAVQASMTIPFLFQPVIIKGHSYVDGYLSCEYPAPRLLDKHHTLGIFLDGFNALTKRNKRGMEEESESFYAYMQCLLEIMLFYPKETNRIQEILKYKMILNDNPIEFFPLHVTNAGCSVAVTPSQVDAAIAYGYQMTYDFMNSLASTATTATIASATPATSL